MYICQETTPPIDANNVDKSAWLICRTSIRDHIETVNKSFVIPYSFYMKGVHIGIVSVPDPKNEVCMGMRPVECIMHTQQSDVNARYFTLMALVDIPDIPCYLNWDMGGEGVDLLIQQVCSWPFLSCMVIIWSPVVRCVTVDLLVPPVQLMKSGIYPVINIKAYHCSGRRGHWLFMSAKQINACT